MKREEPTETGVKFPWEVSSETLAMSSSLRGAVLSILFDLLNVTV